MNEDQAATGSQSLSEAIESSMAGTLEFTADGDSVTAENNSEAEESTLQPQEVKKVETEVKEDTKDKGTEETFSKIDPSSLSPELQQVYKSLQADYTRKTQELAKMRKEIEVPKVEPIEQPQEIDINNLSPEEYVEYVKGKALEAVKEQRESDLKSSAQVEYQNLDPRLNSNDNESYDPIADNYVASKLDQLATEHIEKYGTFEGFDYKGEGKKVLTEWDNYQQKLFQSFLGKQKLMAKQASDKSLPKTPVTSQAKTVSQGKVSLKTAMEEAFDKYGDGY